MKKIIFYLVVFLAIFAYVFQNIFKNPSLNLIDWLDYPYLIWQINQTVNHLHSLDFVNFFNTNAFYPHHNTLFFSDLLLPQALVVYLLSFLIDNSVLTFNLLFLLVFCLNFLAVFLFLKSVLADELVAFLGSVVISFSPFYHFQWNHFQMQNYWAFFFSLYFLSRIKGTNQTQVINRFALLSGFFLALQFLAGVYLTVFLIVAQVLYYLLKIVSTKQYRFWCQQAIVVFLFFLLLDGVFIKGYFETQSLYHITRNYGEYVHYSAHFTDYLFSQYYQSWLYSLPIFAKWNSLNQHNFGQPVITPGFWLIILSFVSFASLLKIKLKDMHLQLSIKLEFWEGLFLLLAVVGWIFSLGPRLNVNGVYAQLPLPYLLLFRLPLFNTIRVVARWSYLFYLGLCLLSLLVIKKLHTQARWWLIFLLLAWWLLEYFPKPIKANAETYWKTEYSYLQPLCQQKPLVLLEVPVTHYTVRGGMVQGLNYLSKLQYASLKHHCLLINGYSGYDLPELIKLDEKIRDALKKQDYQLFSQLVKQTQADYLLLNKENLQFPLSTEAVKVLANEGWQPIVRNLFSRSTKN